MPSAKDPLLADGLATLATLLPSGYGLATSSLGKRDGSGETWLTLRGPAGKTATCLVLARRRVETRDLGGIAAVAARTNRPALLVSTCLTPSVCERLRGFGIGWWDLAGNVRLAIAEIRLRLEIDAQASAPGKGSRRLRSLCGEMTGRVARVLADVQPPLALAQVAELARVDAGAASRVVTFLVEVGLVVRRPRGPIEKVDWPALLRRWSSEAPLATRGEPHRTLCARGVSDFLAQLARSGLLHALTGQLSFARLADGPAPAVAILYVDDVPDAMAQFGLHPAAEDGNVILVKPCDRSVYHRSREEGGLRHVSPSLMVADLDDGDAVDVAVRWLAKHEPRWRMPAAALLGTKPPPRKARR
jgi:hypothetical protein